jgi:PII-like signaling protein
MTTPTPPSPRTSLLGEQVLLRAYLLTTDSTHATPTYERLVHRASRFGLAGATVLKGIYGFGARGIIKPSTWHLANPLPVIVECADTPDQIARFVQQEIDTLLAHGLATLERAAVLFYRHRSSQLPRPPLALRGPIQDLSTLPPINAPIHGGPAMNSPAAEDGILLRVFIGESDEAGGKPLYETLVARARQLGLRGATVLRGSMGFGANSVLHTAKIVDLSTDLPIVLEIVDSEQKIQALLPELDALVHEGMITMESVRILAYRHNPADAPPARQS